MYSYEDIYDFLSKELSVSRDTLSPTTDIHVEFDFYGAKCVLAEIKQMRKVFCRNSEINDV